MSIFKTQEAAQEAKDMEAYAATMHEDFQFIMHLDNSSMDKEKTMEMFTFMMNSDDFVTHDSRCLYENDEAMVTHGVMSFPDGTKESVLAFMQIKDGQVIRMETGATLLP
ncbi:nuclear transport factor 2 family protein [Candidatus Pseudothioglobus sp. Uisw_041]|uniref:nuclear transport factor 2 family protein n=1 Tax=Candidatus Pseudothioglobus sp. Uisw_041 TaxID=3230996 RepID=UPI003A8957E2